LNVAALNTSIIISKTGYQNPAFEAAAQLLSHCNYFFPRLP
jgi:hypothetical protein